MIAVARKPPPRVYVDFAHVPVSQWRMHDRLENWARWCRSVQMQSGSASQPIFSPYRTGQAKRIEYVYGALTTTMVDKDDADVMNEAVGRLPEKHRRAVHWSYLHPRNPVKQAEEMGVDLAGLANLVTAARFKLMDMGV